MTEQETHTIICKDCGQQGTVPFKPRKGSEGTLRCKDCFKPRGQ